MTLSIVIVSFNARADLERCLASLHQAPPVTPHEIVVVDNASTDGGPAFVRAAFPEVRVIEQGRNLGFAVANNAGIRATSGELILLLNGDTVVPPGAIDTLVARLRAHPAAAVAGPRLVDTEGRTEISFGAMISPAAELRQKVVGRLHGARVPLVTGWVERQARTERYVDWVSGACLLALRADAVAAGLLDERFFLYTEDVDFCAAVRSRGRKVLFTPAAEVVHARGRSRASAPGAANDAYRRSQIAFYDKHHPRWAGLLRRYLSWRGRLPRG